MLATLKDRTGTTIAVEIVERAEGNVLHPHVADNRVTRFGLQAPAPLATHEAFLLELPEGALVEIEATTCVERPGGSWYVVAYAASAMRDRCPLQVALAEQQDAAPAAAA